MNIGNFEVTEKLGDTTNLKGKVKCISDYDNNWGGCDQVKDYLTVGGIYTVERIEVHSWHTKVWMKEIPGKVFNSVHFEEGGEDGTDSN